MARRDDANQLTAQHAGKATQSNVDTAGASGHRIHPLLILVFLFVLGGTALFYRNTLDDAFITFRFSKHLAEGYGFGAWNKHGPAVEGYTSTLWMLVLGAAHRLGLPITAVAKWIGLLSNIALCAGITLAAALLRRKKARVEADAVFSSRVVLPLSGALVAGYLPLSWYAVSGMETVTAALFAGAAFILPLFPKSTILSGVVFAGLVLIRPEGILLGLCALAFHLCYRTSRGLPRRFLIALLAVVLITFVLIASWRWTTFGKLVPNTYEAKMAGAAGLHVRLGIRYVVKWALFHAPYVIFGAIGIFSALHAARRGNGRQYLSALSLALACFLYGAYVVRSGGDNYSAFPFWRRFIDVIALWMPLVALGIVRVAKSSRTGLVVATLATIALSNAFLLRLDDARLLHDIRGGLDDFPRLKEDPHNPFYLWLAGSTDSTTVIASCLAGELPFVVDATHIDMLGLCTREIAERGTFDPGGPVDSKTDVAWVLAQKPDIIEACISGRAVREGRDRQELIGVRRKMVLDLIENNVFRSEYLFLADAPYEHLDRALFVHYAFWARHESRLGSDTLRVQNLDL